MKRKISLAMTAFAALAVLSGCQHFPEGAQPAIRVDNPAAPNARIQYDQVVITDRALQSEKRNNLVVNTRSKLAVESHGTRRTATGTLSVIVQLRNRTDFPQNIELRTHFFDSSYVESEAPTAWTRQHLDGNTVSSYQESSIGTNTAMHYLVEVREMR